MKTNAILPSFSVPSAGKSSAQTTQATDGLFNHVLTREVAERNSPPAPERSAQKPVQNKDTGAKPPSSQAAAPAHSPVQPQDKTPSAAAAQDAAKTTDKTTAKADGKSPSDKTDKTDKDDADTDAITAPADLLALVASLAGLANAKPVAPNESESTATTADAMEAPKKGKRDIGLDALLSKEARAAAIAGQGEGDIPIDPSRVTAKAGLEQEAMSRQADTHDFAALLKAVPESEPEPALTQAVFAAPSQAALTNQVQAVAPSMNKLSPPVGGPGWDQALGQKIVWMVGGDEQSASLTLNPPDLGPLHVVLSVNNSHATAHFTAAQPEVRQALEDAMPKLREMLGDAGIQLGQANVNAGSPGNQQNGFGERQASSGQRGAAERDADAAVRVGSSRVVARGGNGLVDTFA